MALRLDDAPVGERYVPALDTPRAIATPPSLDAGAACVRCERCGWLDRASDAPRACENCGLAIEPSERRAARSLAIAPPEVHTGDEPLPTLEARLEHAGYEPRAGQLAVARRVLGDALDGVAVLCDAAGAGRSVVASLIVAELRARGEADRVLVLAPSSRLAAYREPLARLGVAGAELVAAVRACRSASVRRALVATSWDVVVVDHAHSLGDTSSALHGLLRALERRRVLVASATPVRDAAELDALAALLRPGIDDPRALLVRSDATAAMVRESREGFEPGDDERALYDAVASLARRAREARLRRALRALEPVAAASPGALATALDRLAQHAWVPRSTRPALRALGERARGTAMRGRLEALVRSLGGRRAVVFTRYRASLDAVVAALGDGAVALHRGLDRAERARALERFGRGGDARVLVCTDAAADGARLDGAASALVHFDPPASAASARRRRGALARTGSRDLVDAVALVARGTIESRAYARLARDEASLAALLDRTAVAIERTPEPGPPRGVVRRALASIARDDGHGLRATQGHRLVVIAERDGVRVERAALFRVEDRRDTRAHWISVRDAGDGALHVEQGSEAIERWLASAPAAGDATEQPDEAAWLDRALRGARAEATRIAAERATDLAERARREASRAGARLTESLATASGAPRDARVDDASRRLRELAARARTRVRLSRHALVVIAHPERRTELALACRGGGRVPLVVTTELATGRARTPACGACGEPLSDAIAPCPLVRHAVCARCTGRACVACARSPR